MELLVDSDVNKWEMWGKKEEKPGQRAHVRRSLSAKWFSRPEFKLLLMTGRRRQLCVLSPQLPTHITNRPACWPRDCSFKHVECINRFNRQQSPVQGAANRREDAATGREDSAEENCACTHVCVCPCTCVHARVCVSARVSARVCWCTCVSMHMCQCTCVSMHVCVCVCVRACVCWCTCVYQCTCVSLHVC